MLTLPALEIEAQALALSKQQRTGLLLKLLDSIEQRPADDPAVVELSWLQEADRRYTAYLRGDDHAISADQAFAELRAEDR